MPTGSIARRQAQYFAVIAVLPQHGHNPVNRSNELDAAGAPTHALGNRQVVYAFLDDGVKAVIGTDAGDGAAQSQSCSFGSINALQLLWLHTLFFGEADSCGSPLTSVIASAVYRRPQHFGVLVRCLQFNL